MCTFLHSGIVRIGKNKLVLLETMVCQENNLVRFTLHVTQCHFKRFVDVYPRHDVLRKNTSLSTLALILITQTGNMASGLLQPSAHHLT